MAEKNILLSEADELDAFLGELEKQQEVREVAGWDSGFTHLNRALNGILPGLHLLIGPPGCGKTSFAKQLLDRIAERNSVAGIFLTFTEKKKELRVRTLARLSGLEHDKIRRGAGFLLHWYGAPKRHIADPEQMPPSWEKLKLAAEEARSWLSLLYLVECGEKATFADVEKYVCHVRQNHTSSQAMVVIDDAQRLGDGALAIEQRLPLVAEPLQRLAFNLQVPILAIWPDLRGERRAPLNDPQGWAERVGGAEVILVMEADDDRTRKLTEPNRAIALHVVKNRGGERGTLRFDFSPSFSRLTEVSIDAAS